MPEKPRPSGVAAIGELAWGAHFCQFYRTQEDLLELLVPFFISGLESNEYCVWITSESLRPAAAVEAMKEQMPDFQRYMEKGQMEILPHDAWYLLDGRFDSRRMMNGWLKKLETAINNGFDGLRVTGDVSWVDEGAWQEFAAYERDIERVIGKCRMIANCTYSLEKFTPDKVIDVVANHQFSLCKRNGRWEQIESYEKQRIENALKRTKEELEFRVKERTADLMMMNKALQLEIAERERVDNELASQSRVLEAFLKYTITPLVFLDREFNFIYVSESFAAACRKITGQLIGKNFFSIFPSGSRPVFEKAVACKEPYQAIARPFIYPDHPEWGHTYWDWSLVPILDSVGEIEFLVFSLSDVTERKRAELALKESEERLRSLVETTNDWIWEVDINNRYTFVSPKVQDILGYAPSEVLGKTPFEFMEPDEAKRVFDIFSVLAGVKKPFELLENTNVHKNGRKVVIETSGMPILGPTGELLGYRGVDRDITERKKAQEEREQMQAQLFQSQKMDTIGKLAGGIAHDFNNLMTIIASFSNLAMKEAAKGSSLHGYIEQIRSAAERAANLTRQLLIFSRRQPTTIDMLDLNQTLQEMLKILSCVIHENIVITTDFAGNLMGVKADKGNIEQLLMNLILNARDALSGGGAMSLRTANVELSHGEVEGLRAGDYVCFTIEDNGVGMSPEVMNRIFEPFFSTKGLGKGIGLGLAVVMDIVKEYGGGLVVSSSPGKGTVFKVYMPALKGAAKSKALSADIEEPTGRGERVLVVEDEKFLRKSVAIVLTKYGYTVFEAESAEEALEYFSKESGNFDLIFSDMILRDINGIDLIEKLLLKNPSLGVLLTSGYMDIESQWPMIQEKGFDFLQKPYEIPELLKLIRKSIDSKSRFSRGTGR